MGQTAGLFWAERLEGEEDDDDAAPEFHGASDWAAWINELMSNEREQEVQDLGCGALLTCYVEDMAEDEIEWTSPAELRAAAERLIALVQADDPRAAAIVGDYATIRESEPAARQELRQDLEVVQEMARWAEARGRKRIACEIG